MKKIVSVIIPTHNRGHLILTAIESVLAQTYSNLELIVIDDGSTDDTNVEVSKIKDNRFKYIKYDKPQGACYARNLGIKEAKGDYIAFNDSDDIWHKDKLEKQLSFLNNTDSDVVFCALARFNLDEYGGQDVVPDIDEGNVTYKDFLYKSLASTQTIFGKAECFKNVLFDENMPRFQDWDLMLRMVQEYKICFQKEALVDVYLQKDSISNSNSRTIGGLRRLLDKNYAGYMKFAKDAYIEFYMWLIREIRISGDNPKKEYLWLLKHKFNFKIFIRCILAYCKLHK